MRCPLCGVDLRESEELPPLHWKTQAELDEEHARLMADAAPGVFIRNFPYNRKLLSAMVAPGYAVIVIGRTDNRVFHGGREGCFVRERGDFLFRLIFIYKDPLSYKNGNPKKASVQVVTTTDDGGAECTDFFIESENKIREIWAVGRIG